MQGEGIGKGHPYDNAYGIMKTMQAELNELRSSLHAEQQQRTREVAELRREVIDLQSRLSQQYAEQSMQHQTVSCALTNETALRGKSIEKVRAELAEAMRRAEEVESLKTIQATQFGKLAGELKTEKKERLEGQKDLDERIRGEVAERRDQCEKIIDDLSNHKAVAEANLAQDRERMDYLTQNVQMAGQLLSTGCSEALNDQTVYKSLLSANSTLTTAVGSSRLHDESPSPALGHFHATPATR
mmetsp:Transcript_22740/g.52040  ORF Transcript_22740/g.52040 Transcript_22740/m.52040 type:complete len:243 (+) Transcript_22740:111-839(+)